MDRTIALHEKGIRIMRFYKSEVDGNLDGILNGILDAVDSEKSLWTSQADKGPSP